jgi:monoamine oxidase
VASSLEGIRIVVIGAGLAGLAAARYSKLLGADVVVLEARERLGGRVHTDRSMGAPIDLGAAAIHGAVGNPLTVLARAASAETLPLNYDSITYYLMNGARIGDDDVDASTKHFENLQRDLRAQAADGESVAQTIRRIAPRALEDPMIALQAGVEFEFDIGGSLAEIGATKLDDHKPFDGGDLILPRGFDQVAVFLARGSEVNTGVLVDHVAASKQGVRIGGSAGTIDADYCICTVPIGVLKSHRITFDPGLPSGIAQAIDRIGAGHVTKIALRFDRVFWDRDPLYIGYASGCPGRFPYVLNLHAIHPDANILVTFALGDYECGLRDQTDQAISQDAVAMLRDIYGGAVEDPSGVCVTRWNSDPLSQCSYSFASPQTRRADFEAFEEAVHGRIIFAGEHTIADSRGTAHGAYLSGKRAASQIGMLAQRMN